MKIVKFFTVYFLLYSFIFSAFEVQNFNSQSIALGGVSSICEPYLNPAAIGFTNSYLFSFNIGNIFGIKELQSCQTVAVVRKSKKWSVRIIGNQLGYKLYIENSLNMGLAVGLGGSFFTGLNLNIYEVVIKEYASSRRLTFDIGFAYSINENFIISVLFRNIVDGLRGQTNSNIPQEFYYAAKYKVAKILSLYSELYKDILFPFTFRMGCKISALKYVDFLAGYQIYPDRFSVGLNVNLGFLRVSVSYLNHKMLPGTIFYGIGCFID